MVFQEWLDYGKGTMRNVSWRAEVPGKGAGIRSFECWGLREMWLVCSRDDSLWVMPESQLDQGSVMPGNLSIVFIFQFSRCLPISAFCCLRTSCELLSQPYRPCGAVGQLFSPAQLPSAGSGCSSVSFSDLSLSDHPASSHLKLIQCTVSVAGA